MINLFIYNCRDYFPWTITYEAFTKDVDKWTKNLKKTKIQFHRSITKPDNIQTLNGMAGKMKDEIDEKKDEMTNKITAELKEFLSVELQKFPAKQGNTYMI